MDFLSLELKNIIKNYTIPKIYIKNEYISIYLLTNYLCDYNKKYNKKEIINMFLSKIENGKILNYQYDWTLSELDFKNNNNVFKNDMNYYSKHNYDTYLDFVFKEYCSEYDEEEYEEEYEGLYE